MASFGRRIFLHPVFEGGAYPLQNLTGQLTIGSGDDAMALYLVKQGVYDDKKLTCDASLDLVSGSDDSAPSVSILYSGSYITESGDYHISLEAVENGSQLFKISASGIVSQLEKGTSIQADIDSLEISTADSSLIFSGNYYFKPLSGEIAPLEGTPMDVLAATEEDWYSLIMEGAYGFMEVADRLGIEPGSNVVYISRLRLADGEPVQVEKSYFPLKYAFLLEEDLNNGSMFECLKEKAGAKVASSEKMIELCRATAEEAALMDVKKGDYLLFVKSTAYDENGEPMYAGIQLINGDRFSLYVYESGE